MSIIASSLLSWTTGRLFGAPYHKEHEHAVDRDHPTFKGSSRSEPDTTKTAVAVGGALVCAAAGVALAKHAPDVANNLNNITEWSALGVPVIPAALAAFSYFGDKINNRNGIIGGCISALMGSCYIYSMMNPTSTAKSWDIGLPSMGTASSQNGPQLLSNIKNMFNKKV